MDTIKTEDSVGMILGHDITEIIPGKFKGIAFKKGHIIRQEDVEKLLRIGKENLFVFNLGEDYLHEDDAAIRLGKLFSGPGIYFTEPGEGKISMKPEYTGLLKINRELLDDVNDTPDMCLATIHENIRVKKDELLAGCRVVPLTIQKKKIDNIEKMAEGR